MKKLLTLAIVFSLALVLCQSGLAQDAAPAAEAPPMTVESVVEDGAVYGMSDACGPVMPYGRHCRPFARRACMPCYANPCNPCPPCPPQPAHCGPFARRAACPPVACGSPCGDPCGDPCGAYGYGAGCGYPGTGYYRTPIRNFLSRIFAPRGYCGYDAFYGPGGYGYGGGYDGGCY